jgi:hypothetical protein
LNCKHAALSLHRCGLNTSASGAMMLYYAGAAARCVGPACRTCSRAALLAFGKGRHSRTCRSFVINTGQHAAVLTPQCLPAGQRKHYSRRSMLQTAAYALSPTARLSSLIAPLCAAVPTSAGVCVCWAVLPHCRLHHHWGRQPGSDTGSSSTHGQVGARFGRHLRRHCMKSTLCSSM